MIFAIGDLIILLIVVVALVVYRQLDKNNRSLDKIRKYTDKVQSDLDGLVQSKTNDIKNLSIELEVHLKTAKEVLKRISAMEDNISGKTKGVDEIRKRINEYDKSINELVSMTKKVDENLKRLHEESEFVDTVGRRVRESTNLINQIEKSIPNLKQEFARQNSDQMKIISSEVVKATGELVDSLTEELNRTESSVKDFSQFVEGLQAQRESMEDETVSNLRTRFQEFIGEADESRLRMTDLFKNDIKDLLGREETNGRELIEEIQQQQSQLKHEVDQTQEILTEKLEAYQDRMMRIEDEYQRVIREVAEKGRSLEDEIFTKLKDHVEARAQAAENSLSGVMSETKDRLEQSRKELTQMFGETRSELTVWRAEVRKSVEEQKSEFLQNYEAFSTEMASKLQIALEATGKTQSQQRLDLEEFIEASRSGIEELEKRIQLRVTELSSVIDGKESEFRQKIENTDKLGKQLAESVQEGMEKHVDTLKEGVNSRFVHLEDRVSEYEEAVSYRFSKIEAVNSDIESLENNLKKSVDRAAAQAQKDLRTALSTISEEKEAEKQKANEQLDNIRQSLDTIDRELVELKSRAYENVSAQLQVFEDEFFTDLRDRSEQLHTRLESWQKDLQERLEALGTEHRQERADIERTYDDELKSRIASIESSAVERYEQFGGRVDEFQNGLEDRIKNSDTSFRGFEDEIKQEIGEVKENARANMDQAFSEFNATVEEQLRQREREVDSSMRVLGERMETSRSEILSVFETASSDVTSWQTNVLQQMKEARSATDGEIDKFKGDMEHRILSISEDFERQKEDLIVSTEAERKQLAEQLEMLAQKIDELQTELQSTATRSLETLSRQADEFTAGFLHQAVEVQTQTEQKVREFRSQVGETREKVDGIQQKLYGKVEENYKILSLNLQEIDKRQKNFLSQTKLFERADSLKLNLIESIEDIKSDMIRLDEQRVELRSVEKNFLKTQKMGEAVSNKLARFLSEKRRIDSMDQDFKKLLSLSQTVDSRLGKVTASHDSLQEIQAKIRGLEDLEKEVGQRYDRLENRKQIIDATTAGVDQNFQRLETLETEIQKAEQALSPVSIQLQEIGERLDILNSNRTSADQALKVVNQLDDITKDLEARMETMQKAREWLAGTETRLTELNKEIESQLKLMSTLLKDGAKKTKKDRGAPTNSYRDIVAKLARQGWTVDQIVQTTGLSRGEVELILELQPRN